jgi:hypothetical protein
LLRIGHDLGEFRRRDAVAGNVDFALLQAEQGDDGLLSDFEGDGVEIGNAGAPVVRILLKDQPLACRPFGEAGLPKSAPNSSTASLATTEAKFSPITCRNVASGRDSAILTVSGSGVVTPESVVALPEDTSS